MNRCVFLQKGSPDLNLGDREGRSATSLKKHF